MPTYILNTKKQHSPALIFGTLVLITIAFFLGGEIFFRLRYFGIQSIQNPYNYIPANYDSPLLGKPQKQGYLFFKGHNIYINNYGYRDNDWQLVKPKEVIRIAIVGSSKDFGSGVNDTERYSSVLKSMLNQDHVPNDKYYEILNFSQPNSYMDSLLTRCEKEVIAFNPDYIIINADRWKSTKPSPVLKNSKALSLSEKLKYIFAHPETVSFFIHAIKQKATPQVKETFFPDDHNPGLVKTNELPELYIYQPKDMPCTQYTSRLINLAQRYKILLIIMPELSDQKYHIYPGDVHPNQLAHKSYANELYKCLKPSLH